MSSRNDTPLTPAQAALAGRSVGWAREVRRRCRGLYPGVEASESESAALYGLVLAARSYRGGCAWETYSYGWIKGQIRDEADSARRRRRPARPRPEGDGAAGPPWAADAIAALPEPLATTCRLVFLEGRDRGEAGAMLGITRRGVCRRLHAAMPMLRELIGGEP